MKGEFDKLLEELNKIEKDIDSAFAKVQRLLTDMEHITKELDELMEKIGSETGGGE